MAIDARPSVERALELIEEARRLMNRAAEELCPVMGLVNEWKRTCKVYEAIHKHWYRVKEGAARVEARGRLEMGGAAERFARRSES